jgi:hypothetical protein
MKVCITYPPEFDGELHITTKREPLLPSHDYLKVEFRIAMKPGEKELDTLKRVAQDILHQPKYLA